LLFINTGKCGQKTPRRSAWLSDHNSGKKAKQEEAAHFATSPPAVRDGPSSATQHSGKMGVPRFHPRRSNRAVPHRDRAHQEVTAPRDERRAQSLSHTPQTPRVALGVMLAGWEGITERAAAALPCISAGFHSPPQLSPRH